MTSAGDVAERAFFQEEFRRRTIVIALGDPDVDAVVPVIRVLAEGETRVIAVARRTDGRVAAALGCELVDPPVSGAELAGLWAEPGGAGIQVVGVDADPTRFGAQLAGSLGVTKLVLTDSAGGWGRSFASVDDVADGAEGRPVVAEAVRRALDGGVGGVNVCRAADLDTELFTFDGAGTLFTSDAYVEVSRLRADDLSVVEQLVARGVAEGHLRPRPRIEVVRLALEGLGARVGPNRHLAGFGALEVDRYASVGVAEVTCLYTVNRYEGEGVAGRLVAGLVDAARLLDVGAVFACTVSDRASALFTRSGFRPVSQDRLPPEKWVDYDPARRDRLAAHWLELDDATGLESSVVPSARVATSPP